MARIRTIKPGFFTSGDIVDLSPLARLFYIGLWCEADREGRLSWNTRTLKLRYLPADECDIDALAGELIDREMLVIYEVDGKQYAEIPSFTKHQVINNREAASQIPARVQDACMTRESTKNKAEIAPSADASFTRESGVKAEGRKGREGKGKKSLSYRRGGEGEGAKGPAQNPEPYPAEFEAAWAAYPKRSGGNSKKAAFDAWRARVRAGADPADLLAGASRYAEFVRGEGKEGSRFVMMAATFFGPGEHYAEPWQAESDGGAGFDWGDAL